MNSLRIGKIAWISAWLCKNCGFLFLVNFRIYCLILNKKKLNKISEYNYIILGRFLTHFQSTAGFDPNTSRFLHIFYPHLSKIVKKTKGRTIICRIIFINWDWTDISPFRKLRMIKIISLLWGNFMSNASFPFWFVGLPLLLFVAILIFWNGEISCQIPVLNNYFFDTFRISSK